MAEPAPNPLSMHEPIGTIIHIGAGRCSELPQYLAANPERIILIEPQPDRARELRQQTAGHDHVTVIEAAVAGPESGNQLHIFNQRDFASLRAPTGLLEIFPGLRTIREIEVECMAPKALLEHQDVMGQDHWLIIDAPGEEAAIVEALASDDCLEAFTRIDLHCGAVNLYEGDQPAADLLRQLADHGHEIEATDTETDPDRPHWTLRRNTLKLENLALQRKLAAREEELASERARTEDLTAQLDERARERDQARESTEQARAQVEAMSQDSGENSPAAKQYRQQVEKLTSELDEARKNARQLQGKLGNLTQERDKARKAADDARNQIQELTREWDDAIEAKNDAENRLETLAHERQQSVETLQQEKERLEDRVATLEKTAQKLERSHDERAKEAATYQRTAEALEQDKKSLTDHLSQIEKQAEQYQNRIRDLESQLAEHETRRSRYAEEMSSVEGQIDLIKDVLFSK